MSQLSLSSHTHTWQAGESKATITQKRDPNKRRYGTITLKIYLDKTGQTENHISRTKDLSTVHYRHTHKSRALSGASWGLPPLYLTNKGFWNHLREGRQASRQPFDASTLHSSNTKELSTWTYTTTLQFCALQGHDSRWWAIIIENLTKSFNLLSRLMPLSALLPFLFC